MHSDQFSDEYLLHFLLKRDNLSIDDVLQDIDMKNNQRLINKHSETHNIWFADGTKQRWCTYLPDPTKPRGIRLVTRTTEEELYKVIIAYYKEIDDATQLRKLSLAKLYPEWLEYKSLHTNSSNYIRRIDNDWNKYYIGTDIINKPISTLDFLTLEKWAYEIVKDRHLTRKSYTNVQTIIRQELQLAVEKGIIDNNPFERIKIPSKLFKPVERKQDATQVFLIDEEPLIREEAFRDFNETNNTSALAIVFLFETGLRAGELLGLKFSDIDEYKKNYVHINRTEIRSQSKDRDTGKWSPAKYEVVPYAKTLAGIRDVYLTEEARRIISLIRKSNDINGFDNNGFIFMNVDKGKTHIRQIDYRIRKYCNKLGIGARSLHKIRKTYISTLIDSNVVSINTIKTMVGHTDARTTYNSYVYSRKNDLQTEIDIERALKRG